MKNDPIQLSEQAEENAYICHLLATGELEKYEPKVTGILKKFLDVGHSGLSGKQDYWVNKVLNDFTPGECLLCERDLSYQDVIDDELLGGVCSSCHHDYSKRN